MQGDRRVWAIALVLLLVAAVLIPSLVGAEARGIGTPKESKSGPQDAIRRATPWVRGNPRRASPQASVAADGESAVLAGILVEKTASPTTVRSGSPVDYSFEVTNPGSLAIGSVTLSDNLCSPVQFQTGDTNSNGLLDHGEVWRYTCRRTLTEDTLNIASVTGQDLGGTHVSDTDNALVDVIHPAVEIVKSPDLQVVVGSGPALFEISLTNVGDVEVTNVHVSDPQAAGCNLDLGALAPSQTVVYSCGISNVTASLTNAITVTAVAPAGPPVTDTASADVAVVNPSILVSKGPDTQVVASGSPAVFTLTVTNTGDLSLDDVAVSDALAPECDRALGSLAPGASAQYTCSLSYASTSFTNLVTATATSSMGPVVSDTDTAELLVVSPAVMVSKRPDWQMIVAGSSPTFTIAVTNTGDVELSPVVVADLLVPACDRSFGALAPGAAERYWCSVPNAQVSLTNVVTVTGTPAVGPQVRQVDAAELVVVRPGMAIANHPDWQVVRSGDTATFTVSITNTGDVALEDVTVTDSAVPTCNRVFSRLAADEATRFSCQRPGVTAAFTHVISVTASPPVGRLLFDAASAVVQVIHPAIVISKLPDHQLVIRGGEATFTIGVTNTGDCLLTAVTVTDAAAPACDRAIGLLQAAEGYSYTCTVPVAMETWTNLAVVSGDAVAGPPATDQDVALVQVLEPALVVGKQVWPAEVAASVPVTFTVSITNAGEAALASVLLTDTLPAGLSYVEGSGDPGEPASQMGAVLVWSDLGPLAPGDNVQVSFRSIAQPGSAGVYSNEVVAVGLSGGAPVAGSAEASLLVRAPLLTVEKQLVAADLDLISPNVVTFTITITNDGISTIDLLPLEDLYDRTYLSFRRAYPAPTEAADDGSLRWADLTGPEPNGLSMNLVPGGCFSITVAFEIVEQVDVTINSAIVTGARDVYGNLAPAAQDEESVIDLPTAVLLNRFRASPTTGGVVLEWESAWEWYNWGFYLYRGLTRDRDAAAAIGFVLGQGWGQFEGQLYRFLDQTADPGRWYYYWVEAEDIAGKMRPAGGPAAAFVYRTRLYLPLALR